MLHRIRGHAAEASAHCRCKREFQLHRLFFLEGCPRSEVHRLGTRNSACIRHYIDHRDTKTQRRLLLSSVSSYLSGYCFVRESSNALRCSGVRSLTTLANVAFSSSAILAGSAVPWPARCNCSRCFESSTYKARIWGSCVEVKGAPASSMVNFRAANPPPFLISSLCHFLKATC